MTDRGRPPCYNHKPTVPGGKCCRTWKEGVTLERQQCRKTGLRFLRNVGIIDQCFVSSEEKSVISWRLIGNNLVSVTVLQVFLILATFTAGAGNVNNYYFKVKFSNKSQIFCNIIQKSFLKNLEKKDYILLHITSSIIIYLCVMFGNSFLLIITNNFFSNNWMFYKIYFDKLFWLIIRIWNI